MCMNVTIFHNFRSPSGTSIHIHYNEIIVYKCNVDGEPKSEKDVTIYARVHIEACACGWCEAKYEKRWGLHIHCKNCDIRTSGFQGVKKTIKEWNSIALVSRVIHDL